MPRVLIIEDEPGITMVLTELLSEHGHEVITAHNGKNGLDMLKVYTPDIIFVDLQMPEMNGRMVVEIMQSDARLRTIPVVIMTGSVLNADILPPRGSFRAIIGKPFDLRDILTHVDSLAS